MKMDLIKSITESILIEYFRIMIREGKFAFDDRVFNGSVLNNAMRIYTKRSI